MSFIKSNFFFLYNIPLLDNENNVLFDECISEFKMMPDIRDNTKCGFAYAHLSLFDANLSDEDSDLKSAEVIANTKRFAFSKLIECDEVWLNSTSSALPNTNTLVKTNFIFVYNLPTNNMLKNNLISLTNSKNLVIMDGVDGKTKCAFVELPAMSDKSWLILVNRLRKGTGIINGIEVDDVWVNCTPPVKPPSIAERQMAALQYQNRFVNQQRSISKQQAQHSRVSSIKSLMDEPLGNFDKQRQNIPLKMMNERRSSPSLQTYSANSSLKDGSNFSYLPQSDLESFDRLGGFGAPQEDRSDLRFSKDYVVPNRTTNAAMEATDNATETRPTDLKIMLSKMSDSEVDELVDRIRNNFEDLQQQAELGGTDVNQLLNNVRDIVGEQNERRKRKEKNRSLAEIKELLLSKECEESKAALLKDDKHPDISNDLLGYFKDTNKVPSDRMRAMSPKQKAFQHRQEETFSHRKKDQFMENSNYYRSNDRDSRGLRNQAVRKSSHFREDMEISDEDSHNKGLLIVRSDSPPFAKKSRLEAMASALSNAAVAASSSDKLVRSFFLFVYDIPSEVTLINLLSNVPHVDNFVFMDVQGQINKCGFAFVKTHIAEAREEAEKAFLAKRFGPKGNLQLQVDEVFLQPKTKPSTVSASAVPAAVISGDAMPKLSANVMEAVTKISSMLKQQELQQQIMKPISSLSQQGFSNAPLISDQNVAAIVGGAIQMTVPSQSKSGILNCSSEENIFGVSQEAETFMHASGNNDETLPPFFCVEVSLLPDNVTSADLENILLSRLRRHNDWCLLRDVVPKDRKDRSVTKNNRRALFFGGSINEADLLRQDITRRLQEQYRTVETRVTAANLPDTLAPLPADLVSEIRPRRLLVYNLPQLPLDLLLVLICRFAPKVTSFLCPSLEAEPRLTYGHIYLGYQNSNDCVNDFKQLDEWRVAGARSGAKVRYVVDTGYGKDGPIGLSTRAVQSPKLDSYLLISKRRQFQSNALRIPVDTVDYLAEYRLIGSPLPSISDDLLRILPRYAYDGRSESLYAIILQRVKRDVKTQDIRKYFTNIMNGLCDLLEPDPGWGEMIKIGQGRTNDDQVILSFVKLQALDEACNIFRDKISRRDEIMKKVFLQEIPMYERHKQDTFVPVTAAWADRRGCQFLLFSELPRCSRDEILVMLQERIPRARSFYVPCYSTGTGGGGGTTAPSDMILNHAVARFDDPRDARQAFRTLGSVCHLGVARFEVRLCFAALHKVLSSGTYGNMQVPLHNIYNWLRQDPASSKSNKWITDNGLRSPFYCTCHVDCLPFKPLSMSGSSGKGFR